MADKRRIRRVAEVGGGILEIGSDKRIPDQLLEIYERLSDTRAQLYEVEQLLYEMRDKMGLDPVPDWRKHAPDSY
jgi:hypothetical protein